MTQVPPGWYDAGDGTTRWWDGSAWTAVASPPTEAAAVAQSAPQSNDQTLALIAHLGPLIGLSFVAPLVVYLIVKDDARRSSWVRNHAAEALNFQLSILVYLIVGFILMVVLTVVTFGLALIVFIPLFLALGIGTFILSIIAGVTAGRDEAYRYPLTIRFVG